MLNTVIPAFNGSAVKIEEELIVVYKNHREKQLHWLEMFSKGYKIRKTQLAITVTYKNEVTAEKLTFIYSSHAEKQAHGLELDAKGYLLDTYDSKVEVTYVKVMHI